MRYKIVHVTQVHMIIQKSDLFMQKIIALGNFYFFVAKLLGTKFINEVKCKCIKERCNSQQYENEPTI